jgi:PKD repeat protein
LQASLLISCLSFAMVPVEVQARSRISRLWAARFALPAPLAEYTFEEGEGTTVHDISSSANPLNLEMAEGAEIEWLLGGGISIQAPSLIVSSSPASDLTSALMDTDEITIETWICPASKEQNGPARIVTLSTDTLERNFTLAQGLWDDQPSALYDVRLRTTDTNTNGRPSVSCPPDSLIDELSHVVFTREAGGLCRFFINGAEVARQLVDGSFDNWDPTLYLALGNEITGDRPWLGKIYYVAIYDRSLSQARLQKRYQEGVPGVNLPPRAIFTATPRWGTLPLRVELDAGDSQDPDGQIVEYSWDFGDGQTATGALVEHTYLAAGCHQVSLTVTDDAGNAHQSATKIFVKASPPVVTLQPQSQTVQFGHRATLCIEASGTPELLYRWQKNGVWIPGATKAAYTTPPLRMTDNGSTYRCVVWNHGGRVDSERAVLTVSARVLTDLQALYTFEEGSGNTVHDVSGCGEALDLLIADQDAVAWSRSGLTVNSPTSIVSAKPAAKISHSVAVSNEITIEAWVRPATTTQDGPARIVGISKDIHNRNATLSQGLWAPDPSDLYNVRVRTTLTTDNGQPSPSTPAGSLRTRLTHVVYTRGADGMAKIYLNGLLVTKAVVAGDCSNWDPAYHLALANELTGDRPWLGTYEVVAVYSRALSHPEVVQNFAARMIFGGGWSKCWRNWRR